MESKPWLIPGVYFFVIETIMIFSRFCLSNNEPYLNNCIIKINNK